MLELSGMQKTACVTDVDDVTLVTRLSLNSIDSTQVEQPLMDGVLRNGKNLLLKVRKTGVTRKVTFNLVQTATSSSKLIRSKSIFTVPILVPTSVYSTVWDWLKVTVLIFNIWSFPFFVVFDRSVTWLRVIPDILFCLDIVRNFCTAYYDDDHKLVTSPKLVAHRYLRLSKVFDRSLGFSFYCDVLSVFPFYIAYLVMANSPSTNTKNFVLSLSLVPQCDRFNSVLFYFRTMELSVNSDARKVALSKFCIMLLGSAHWIGCSWWTIASHLEFNDTTWVHRYFHFFLKPVQDSGTLLEQ